MALIKALDLAEYTVRPRRLTPSSAEMPADGFACYLGASINTAPFTGAKLTAVLRWLGEHAGTCVLLVSDYLHRFNIMISHGCDEKEALEQAMLLGDNFLKEAQPIIDQHAQECFQILRLGGEQRHPLWRKVSADIDYFLQRNPDLWEYIRLSAHDYLGRRALAGHQLVIPKQEAEKLCMEFLVEEITEDAMLSELGFRYEVYPGEELPILRHIAENTFPNCPASLAQRVNIELRFKKRRAKLNVE